MKAVYFLSIILFIFTSTGCSEDAKDTKMSKTPAAEKEVGVELLFPIVFAKNSAEIKTGKNLERIIKKWTRDLGENGNHLKITGQYFQDEGNPTRFMNLGLARAAGIKTLLAEKIDANRMTLSSKLMTEDFKEVWKQAYAVTAEKGNVSDLPFSESEGKLIIHFAKGRNKTIITEAVSSKLLAIANEMKSSNLGANIICHTDKTSNTKNDYELGQTYANEILDFLVANGANAGEIRASSMGSTQPKAEGVSRRLEIIFSSK